MHRHLFFTLFVMVAAGSLRLSAQIRIGPQEDYHLGPYAGKTPDSLSLKGADARLSFLQQSDDLVHWTDCVLIAADANGVILCDLTPTRPTGFVRLEDATGTRTNQADDFDGDGISDAEEWRQGTDPFSAALDTNGLPLDWEKYYGVPPGVDPNAVSPRTDGLSYLQAFQEGIDPVGYHADLLPTLTTSGDRQTGPPGGFVPAPLVVLATGLDGEPMVDVPIRFQVDTGLLQASSSASPAGTIFARTDADGKARAFCQLSDLGSTVSRVTASATLNGQSVSVVFTVNSDDGKGTYLSPFAPTVMALQGNPDGSVDMSWENHSYDETPIEISFQQADGSCRLIARLPAGTTSYHQPPSD